MKTSEKWLVDLDRLTCYNMENQMLIAFEKKGTTLRGSIKELPLALSKKLTEDPNGNTLIRKAFIEADEVFFKKYFNNKIEEKHLGVQLMA